MRVFALIVFWNFSEGRGKRASVNKTFSRAMIKSLWSFQAARIPFAHMLELFLLGYDVTGLHIDLSIPGSSDQARRFVEAFCDKHSLPLIVKEMAGEGLAIPDVKARLNRPICSACGKIKRHYFNKVALEGNFSVMATGHNLDDEIARLFSNVLRWDSAYLADQGPALPGTDGFARKVKPFWRLSEFETANYAFLQGIEYHHAPCPYSKGASFTMHKKVWTDIEEAILGRKLDFYQGFLKNGKPHFMAADEKDGVDLAPCGICSFPTSADICGVCRIRDAVAQK
jgi:uncharacterized protein (TIGR00269 family)